jgi:hypothetical protein
MYRFVSLISGIVLLSFVAACGGNKNPTSPTSPSTPTSARTIGLSGNLAFGNVQVGSTASALLTITNTGSSTLTVTGISYPTGFSGSWNGGVPAGGSQQVTVTFAPTSASNFGGTVTVNGDHTSGTNTITASGAGVAAPTRVMGLTGSLSFGTLIVGNTRTATLIIANSGNATLTVSSITLPNGFSANWQGGTIAASGSQTVTVTFSPGSAADYSGTVTVNADNTSGSNTISISGTGRTLWNRSGTGDMVFDMPTYVSRVRVTGTFNGYSSNFVVWVGSHLLVNELLGTGWGHTSYDGTLLTSGGVVQVTNSSGVSWSFSEVQ